MSSRFGESHASVHRKATQEALRGELNRALAEIYDAKWIVKYLNDGKIYCYGSEAECRRFADGLHRVEVRPITDKEKHELAKAKRQAYGNP